MRLLPVVSVEVISEGIGIDLFSFPGFAFKSASVLPAGAVLVEDAAANAFDSSEADGGGTVRVPTWKSEAESRATAATSVIVDGGRTIELSKLNASAVSGDTAVVAREVGSPGAENDLIKTNY